MWTIAVTIKILSHFRISGNTGLEIMTLLPLMNTTIFFLTVKEYQRRDQAKRPTVSTSFSQENIKYDFRNSNSKMSNLKAIIMMSLFFQCACLTFVYLCIDNKLSFQKI